MPGLAKNGVVCRTSQSALQHQRAATPNGERPIIAMISKPIIHGSYPREASIRLLGPEHKGLLWVAPSGQLKPNAGAHLLPEAGATQERTLEAVKCSARLCEKSIFRAYGLIKSKICRARMLEKRAITLHMEGAVPRWARRGG